MFRSTDLELLALYAYIGHTVSVHRNLVTEREADWPSATFKFKINIHFKIHICSQKLLVAFPTCFPQITKFQVFAKN